MIQLVFFLEEPSAEAMLQGFLPKILPEGLSYRCIVFEGKQDLDKQLLRRIRGYQVPDARFVILRDQDSSDCKKIKDILLKKCKEAGRCDVLIRIACHELESWYLADLVAVERGLGQSGLSRYQNKRKFFSPDDYPFPSQTLKSIVPAYQKVSGSRAIGQHLFVENNRSRSFFAFVAGIRHLCAAWKV